MLGLVFALCLLLLMIYGYFKAISPSKLEREIRKNNLPYTCFECKEEFSVNELKCPKCAFETLYGKRRKNYWMIFGMLFIWIFMVAKWARRGIIG